MGALSRLHEELEELAEELEKAEAVPEVVTQPQVTRAKVAVDEARTALGSAFLSRRALVVAREAVGRAHTAVTEALDVSRTLRERSLALRATAGEVRTMSESARTRGGLLASEWSRRIEEEKRPGQAAEVRVENGIPREHPQADAIETAVKDALSVASGRWQVWITCPTGGTWWGLRVKGPAIDWVVTLQDPSEQTVDGVVSRLEPVVRVAVAESLYRRARRGIRLRRDPSDGETV